MRKEAKEAKVAQIARVQGYHEGGSWEDEQAYAFRGFRVNKYFRSDRPMILDEHFNRPDGYPLQGFGLEIETECSSIKTPTVLAEILDKVVFAHFPDDLFKMQRDGSLGGSSSAECITQVMTKAFIRNHYRDFKLMWNTYFKELGIVTDCYRTNCGMHVNVSNAVFGNTPEKQLEAVRKLFYIVNRHYDFCCSLFYRNPARTMYCGQMQYGIAQHMLPENMPNDHGKSMNLSHFSAGRVEIRLVGGQRDYGCFRNTMESVFFLCERVRNISWKDCDSIVKIFRGCNQYVYDRLESKCNLSAEALEAIRLTVKVEDLI